MKITIDQDKCIGCGSCQATCEESFAMGDDNNKPYFKQSDGKAREQFETDKPGCFQEAADICPVQAIGIEK